jgi:hypothetical protein
MLRPTSAMEQSLMSQHIVEILVSGLGHLANILADEIQLGRLLQMIVFQGPTWRVKHLYPHYSHPSNRDLT